ncbi:Spy0128 family protein [Ruminococcus sp.]|uniref:Spy0128 family protein n=1 Tax=Ruminococcus sp. TaxID=41978 RepID=UPI003F10BE6B
MTDSCVTDIRKRHDRNIRLAWVLLILALVISSSVAWLLRGVGITLANETTCGLAEHQHSAVCYMETAEGSQLICEIPEHVHTVECAGVTRQEQAIPVVEIITPTEADEETAAEEESRETDKLPVYLADSSYTKNVIYVVTALGERDKNTVHEYLSGLGLPGENDGQYIKNSSEAPYILQVGDTVELCIYVDSSNGNGFWSSSSPDGVLSPVSTVESYPEDGVRKVTKIYRTNAAGTATIYFGDQAFYISVPDPNQTLADFHFDHADIEITDGGFYEVTRTVTDHSGRQVTTRQIFDSYITMVNHCYLYDESKSVIMHYESSDYEAHGTPGETQYELTSKYQCMGKQSKWFKRDEIETAQFDVQLLLKPRTQIVTITDNGTVVSQTETDISDSTGASDITIPSAVFDMNHRSVIDANNKCPDHSGLDFNLMANVNELMDLEPAFVQPTASKQLTDGTIGENQFQFELLDSNGKLVDRQYCNASGQVTFAEQFFLLPGTYTYTIRETIPSAAVKVDGQTYYNGIFYDTHTETVTVTVTQDAAGNLSASMAYASGAAPVFRNRAVPESYVALNVQKVWDDGGSTVDHSSDAIAFRIFRSESGQSDSLVSIDGKTKFYLTADSGWKWSYDRLPVQYAGHTYSYRVEEIDIPEGYVVRYSTSQEGNVLNQTITNTAKASISISIQKQWLAPDGTPMQGEPSVQSITALVQRQCKEIEIPVTVQVVNAAGTVLEQYKQMAYAGSGFTFTLGVTEGTAENLSVVSNSKCTASYNSGVFTVQDIQPGALVKVRCDNVADASKLLLHQTFEGTHESWSGVGTAQMGNAYSTNYVANGTSYHALKIYNRTASWSGAAYTLDTNVYRPGQTYSFSAYVCRSNNYTASDNSTTTPMGHDAPLGLTLCYKTSSGDDTKYLPVDAVDSSPAGSWVHLGNAALTIPSDCTSMWLQVDTSGETGSNQFSDLYLDEVIIAPSGLQISVEQGTGRVLLDNPEYFSFTVTGKTIPVAVQQAAENWQLDSWSKQITITAAEGWIKTLSAAELDEVPNREYQYFVQEDPLSGFTPSYSDMYVSSNTTQNPMIIKNQSIAYTLPATGGVGLAPFLGGGAVLILGSVLFSYQLIRKRRRSSA